MDGLTISELTTAAICVASFGLGCRTTWSSLNFIKATSDVDVQRQRELVVGGYAEPSSSRATITAP